MIKNSQNVIGILTDCWCIFQKNIALDTEIIAAITPHNWLWKNSMCGKDYNLHNLCDTEAPQTGEITEGLWRSDPPTEG